MKRFSELVASALLVASLTACGGGGGGGTPVANGNTIPAGGPPASSIIVSTVPASTYPLASEELQVFDLLNAERSRCGFGLLAQNVQADNAARAHADYQIRNNLISHFEDKVAYPAGFTGVTVTDRLTFQGYMDIGEAGDNFATSLGSSVKTGEGVAHTRSLLNAPYHLAGLVLGFRDVGIAVRSNTDIGVGAARLKTQFNLAYKSADGKQVLGISDVNTYPCDGSSGVDRQLRSELPNPVPGRDLATSPLGSSVYVQIRDGQNLQITGATMTNVSTGVAVSVRPAIGSANDPHAIFQQNQAYVAADAPMVANTAYRVSLTGTNNGTPFNKTFVFTTGAGG